MHAQTSAYLRVGLVIRITLEHPKCGKHGKYAQVPDVSIVNMTSVTLRRRHITEAHVHLHRFNLEGGKKETVHDNVGIPPDGAGEVRVVGQPQPEVTETIASQVCTEKAKGEADKTELCFETPITVSAIGATYACNGTVPARIARNDSLPGLYESRPRAVAETYTCVG